MWCKRFRGLFLLSVLGSVALGTVVNATTTDEVVYLSQGWDQPLREKFYFTGQGSRIMPYDWFVNLEQATSNRRFAKPDNLAVYGWLKAAPSQLNPDGLPVGFAKDPVKVPGTGYWVGLTCAACHTNDIQTGDTVVRIDGAATLADFGRFTTDLNKAVQATLLNEDKFKRFAAAVLGQNVRKEQQVVALQKAFAQFAVDMAGRSWMRTPPLPAGPGRVDALGQIVNAMSVFDLEVPENLRAVTAPVSYPFLWYTPKLDWVQWNPVAASPIARNVGEVLGVFGHADFTSVPRRSLQRFLENLESWETDTVEKMEYLGEELMNNLCQEIPEPPASYPGHHGTTNEDNGLFGSTVQFTNLYLLERWVAVLKHPRWNDKLFGAVNMEKAKQGKALFNRDCLACHNMPPFRMTNPEENICGKRFIKISHTSYKTVGTDPLYTENLLSRFVNTGPLVSTPVFGHKTIVPAAEFFLGGVAAVTTKGMTDLRLTPQEQLAYNDYRFYPPTKPGEAPKPYQPVLDRNGLPTYLKGGPLLGIWATGPFLHNGSVPNVYELLSPPENRSRVFWVGNRQLDSEKLGFVSTETAGSFRFDTRQPGNANTGHIYPKNGYTEEERMAVLEYLKDPMRLVEDCYQ